jgi:Bacterial Ig-like domain
MTAATDTGVSTVDGITNNLTPTFAGLASLPDATSVQLFVDGVPKGTDTALVGGAYSITTTALTAGTHKITVGEVGPSTGVPVLMGNTSSNITIDTTAPAVTSHTAVGTRVAQGANVTATFGEGIFLAGSTMTLKKTFTGAAIGGVISYNATSRTATFNPWAALAPATRYTATLTPNIRDLAGNSLKTTTWAFETGPRPTVLRKSPLGTTVNRSANMSAIFSESISLRGATVTLMKTSNGAAVGGKVSYNPASRIVTMNPTALLAPRTRYTVTLTSNIMDADGNSLTPRSWVFETGR